MIPKIMMDSLEMDTSAYQGQIVSATGQITTDFFNFSLITRLFVGWGQTLLDVIIEGGPDLIFKVLLFLIIIYCFFKIANIVQKLIESGLAKSHLQLSELLRRMVVPFILRQFLSQLLADRCRRTAHHRCPISNLAARRHNQQLVLIKLDHPIIIRIMGVRVTDRCT